MKRLTLLWLLLAFIAASALAQPSREPFSQFLSFVLKWEGGFTDDPDDAGGATNLGIIQVEYDRWRKAKGLSRQSVRHITQDEARAIYRANYWQPLRCDETEWALAGAMFDCGVNMGNPTCVRLLQRIVGVIADGKLGPVTWRAILKFGAASLVKRLCDAREALYRRYALKGNQRKYLQGWLNRLNDLRRLVLSAA